MYVNEADCSSKQQTQQVEVVSTQSWAILKQFRTRDVRRFRIRAHSSGGEKGAAVVCQGFNLTPSSLFASYFGGDP